MLTVECRTDATDSDVIVIDGAALVKPVACELETFDDYAAKVFYTEAVEASRQGGYIVGSVP